MPSPRTAVLHSRQREHIAAVMQVAGAASPLPTAGLAHDAVIHDSWQRCVHQHRLDPTRMQEAVILPSPRLREHQDQMEAFLHIARHGLETLYQQVAGLGYVVLLTDARGVTVDFIGDLQLDTSLRRAGLYLGSDWSEQLAGTCGVGTCISNGRAITVHQGDHFDATHIPLTCSAAPVYDALGQLNAVLDISALSSPQPKDSQHLALQLVKVYAGHIENASFLHRFRHDWVLRLSAAPQFLDVNPDYLLALDASGRLIGHNRRAQLILEAAAGAHTGGGTAPSVIGRPFEQLFDAAFAELGRFVPLRPSDQRAIRLAGSRQLLFMLASPPPLRPLGTGPRQAGGERPLPAPLAALSGGDPALDRQIERAARLVNSPVNMLLTGETGSGKEFFAKALHQSSERRRQPFIAVNCAAIPETLIESELFGHLPGSFSGALNKGKRGLIQESDGGTLFLDEIGDMPRALQARLLRVLAEREVLPIGATRPVPVNLRVIAATHCQLDQLVREGRFRDDLYYRLNGAHVQLPPLRERADLDWLVERLLAQGLPPGQQPPPMAPEVLALLHRHRWPGNLRELRNVIDYARAVCGPQGIELHDLPDDLTQHPEARHLRAQHLPAPPPGEQQGDLATRPPEACQLEAQLRAAHWNITAVARDSGLSRMTLYRRMKRWGIRSPVHADGGGDD